MKPAFVFDPDRCTGCEACRIACAIENNHGRDNGWRTITTFNPSRHPALPTRHLSLACNHCDTPACAIGCPASAYDRDEKTGAVLLDPEKCIGCRYCSWLCPYDAPKFDETRGVMTKCTFCNTRLNVAQTLLSVPSSKPQGTDKSVCATQASQPACTAACPTGALSLGGRETVQSEPSFHGLGSFGLGPALRVERSRHSGPPPALAIDELVFDAPSQPAPQRKITLSSEWSLLLFTIVMPALVAWVGGGIVLTERRPPLIAFIALAAVALTMSILHLGKPWRAWRAILNVRTSWLSREILFTNLFLLSGGVFVALEQPAVPLGLTAFAMGIGLAFSIDSVYRAIPRIGAKPMHSAEAVPTMVLFFGIFASLPLVTIAAALVKAALFGRQWARREIGVPGPVGALRMIFLAIASMPAMPSQIALPAALIGEIIDRAGFYDALEPTSPGRLMEMEVERAI